VETDRDVEDFLENHLEGVCFAEFCNATFIAGLRNTGMVAPCLWLRCELIGFCSSVPICPTGNSGIRSSDPP
jgi:hypothetical protein